MIAVTAERLEQLRLFARIERDTILEHMMRDGRDPADAVVEVPSVDEFVVTALRDDLLEERGQLAEFALARLAGRASGDSAVSELSAEAHRRDADLVEFALLREIAVLAPELTPAVWSLSGKLYVGGHAPRSL